MTAACCSKEIKKYFLSFWNNATDTTEDGSRKKVHSDNGIRSLSFLLSNKDQREADTKNFPEGESLKKGNQEEVLLNTKKQKIHTKTISKRASVARKVPLHHR